MATIKVNKERWDTIPEDERTQIIDKLKAIGSLKPDDEVVPDPEVLRYSETIQPAAMAITPQSFGEMACDALAVTGRGYCLTLGPLGALFCLYLVEEAKELCYDALR